MPDTFSPSKRSWIMSRVRDKNTEPELIVRSIAHRMGYRFRLHSRLLHGKPDLVFPSRRSALFVHGCFWHGHDCPRGARIPATNSDYWTRKIARTRERDFEHTEALREDGWNPFVIWECQLQLAEVQDILLSELGPPGRRKNCGYDK